MGTIYRGLKTVLILGHNGFLGSHLVNYLREMTPYKVKTLKRSRDLRDYNNVVSATRGVDWVFSLAADMGGIGYFNEANYYPPINNFLIDLNVLKACEKNKVKRLFYPASACVYPLYMMGKIPLEESMLNLKAEPDKMYGWEKLTMIKLLKYSPLDVRVGVLHTIYGEGQAYKGKKAKFPPQIAFKALEAIKTNEIEVWGNGEQTRTFLHINDAIDKIMQVMEDDNYYGEVNIGSDKEVSINEVVKLCCNILKIKPKIKHKLSKPVGPERRSCSNEKFNKHYDKVEEIPLKEGFTKLFYYIKEDAKL